MKVKDTSMGSWISQFSEAEAAEYIAGALKVTQGGIFWDIIEHYDLRAQTPLEMGHKVFEQLMEWELDPPEERE